MNDNTKRKETLLHKGWYIKKTDGDVTLSEKSAAPFLSGEKTESAGWIAGEMPNTVQEILFEKGLLDKSVLETGAAGKTTWVSDYDWAFYTEFSAEDSYGICRLVFDRLDTYADIFLNGENIGRHESMFMPSDINVSGKLKERNSLLLYFHRPGKIVDSMKPLIPERYGKKLGAGALLRKPHGDFSPHAGVIPYFTSIGVFGPIRLVQMEKCELRHVDADIRLNEDLSRADIAVTLLCTQAVNIIPSVSLAAPNGEAILSEIGDVSSWEADGDKMRYSFLLSVDNPELWWPAGYGEQPLYKLEASIYDGDAELQRDVKNIGLRKAEMTENLKFRVNHVVVRLWGSCIVPMWGVSHKWQRERGLKILDYALKANMKALRLWGPSQPYDDEFYDECDRKGILIWQEFHTVGTHIADLPVFTEKVVEEAEFMVRRLKHRPCILLWCGGNESIYMADIFDPKASDRIGHDLIKYTLREVAMRLDPVRYYHVSCPSGGWYANEARVCDNHGSRASLSFLPGENNAHFFSEDIRTSVPELKSVRRFIPAEDLWPDGYIDTTPYGVTAPMPPAWMKRTINHMEEKAGPYEQFYDATDPRSLIHKMNEAAVFDNRLIINHIRQGKPFYNSMAEREGNGYLIWKMETAWPQMYCALIDYYMEPCRTYYGTRRAYEPVKVTVDLQDHVYIWGVNDTREHFGGTLTVKIYDLNSETELHNLRCPVGIPAGDSLIIKNLDDFGQFWRTSVIYACLENAGGAVISEDFQYVKAERKLRFPEAVLTVRKLGDRLIEVSTDKFARCVELAGDDNGDQFGWHFENNYFDLMPGQSKQIRLFGSHDTGTITARAFYSPHRAAITL